MTQPLEDCPGCGAGEAFEQVHPAGNWAAGNWAAGTDCPDLAAGAEACTEWICLGCGAGVFMGIVPASPRAAALTRRSARAA